MKMTYKCKSPNCDHEFVEDGFGDITAKHFAHTYPCPDGFGICTDFLCSVECLLEYLEERGELR